MGRKDEIALSITRINAITNFLTAVSVNAIRWGSICAIAYFAYLSVDALAGKATFAKIAVEFLANITVKHTVAYSFGIFGTIYGWRQRHLRKKRIAQLAQQNERLEKLIDKHRTSSKLPPTGNTREEDKI